MSKEPIKDGFTSEKCNFQGVPGFMLHQWHNNVVVCSQFVPQKYFVHFCNDAGIDKNDIVYIDN